MLLLLTLALLVHAGLLVLGPLYPTTDGGSHLYNAKLMLEAERHKDLLEWNHWYLPQWTAPGLLAAQIHLLGLESGYRWHLLVVSLALALAIGALTRRWDITLLALTISLNYPFSMGFFSFALGQGLGVGIVLWWVKQDGHLSRVQATLVALLLTLLYFTHFVPFLITAGLLGLLALLRWRRQSPWGTWLACIPGLVLGAAYVWQARNIRYIYPSGPQPLENWWHCFTLYPFLPISTEREYVQLQVATATLFLLAFVFGCWARRGDGGWRATDVLMVLAILIPGVSPLLPDGGVGGSVLQSRMAHFGPLLALVWFALQRFSVRQQVTLGALSFALALAMYGNRLQLGMWLSPIQAEVRSAAKLLPAGTSGIVIDLWPLGYDYGDRERSLWIRPLAHIDGWVAAEAGVFNLFNYEAASGVFPLRYKAGVNPDIPLFRGHPPPDPPMFYLDQYKPLPGREVRFIALINPYGPRADNPNSIALARQLDGWQVSAQTATGLVRIYKSQGSN